MTTVPITPSASSAHPSSGSRPSTSNINKEIPSTPTKAHRAKSQTPSPSKSKEHSPIPARIPTPTSPTIEAGKKTVHKMAQAGQGNKEKENEDGKSLLNPHSSTFEPKSISETFTSKMRNLTMTDQGSSSRYVENVPEIEGPSTPKKKKEVPHFETPRRPIRAETTTATPSLSYTPFAPSTGQSSRFPVTPSTPATPVRREGESISKEKNTREEQFVSGSTEANPDEIGRYLLIQQIPLDTTENEIKNLFQSNCNFKAIVIKHLKAKGLVLVAFYDPREAAKLYNLFQSSSVRIKTDGPLTQLHCMKTDLHVVQSIIGRSSGWEAIWENSQSVIKVEIVGGVGVTVDVMKKTLSMFGELQRLDEFGHTGRCFIAEYFDTRHAAQAISLLDGQKAQQALISVSYLHSTANPALATANSSKYTLGSVAYFPGRIGPAGSSTRSQSDSIAGSDVFGYTTSTEASSPIHTPRTAPFSRISSDSDVFNSRKPSSIYSTASQSRNTSGYSTPQSWTRTSTVGSQSGYDTPAHLLALSRRLHEPGTVEGLINNADIEARARQGQGIGGHWNANDRKAIPAHNRVFPERILSGLDPRTTVMIKDVPNKLSRQELVNILEEVVPGDYDFVYLRFDFKNCCNVLYRFIEAKVGKKWNLFSSEKVLQVSYADIHRGKPALINKFKNSAVMGVIEAWRPQIFYSSGRMKGKPEPFPDSDNLAVRSRSAAAQLAGFSTGSNYSYGHEDQYYDYSSPHGSTYGI
ncbi:hypothetical protein I203_108100 [Kwoniella mangroviensis CBS 8507]|uniref:hypothetical protein n=1 Tax=Kwoniella mangroviensis CBS 8507 TaxID=1296122 RepID=UPI0030421E71